VSGKKQSDDEYFDGWINVAEQYQCHQKSRQSKRAPSNKVEILLSSRLAHQQHDGSASVERRNREEIENSEQKIEGKEALQCEKGKAAVCEPVHGDAYTQANHGDNHQDEVCGRTGEGHPGGAARMLAFPIGIVRGAGETDHATAKQEKAKKRENHHAVRRAANVRNGIQADLPALGSGFISAPLGYQGMSSFVAGGGEQKNQIKNEAVDQLIWREEVRHKFIRLGGMGTESKATGRKAREDIAQFLGGDRVAPIDKLTKHEREKLLADLNYLNLGEIKTFCKARGIPYRIVLEGPDGQTKATGEDDRKGVILERVRHYLMTGKIGKETLFPSRVVNFGALAKKPAPSDKIFYGQYDKGSAARLALLKTLTGGKFRDGAVARILAREFWTQGKAPSFAEFAQAWLNANEEHIKPNPEWAFLTDRTNKTAPKDWKKLRLQKANTALKTLVRIAPIEK
jgi:hypothetical protein